MFKFFSTILWEFSLACLMCSCSVSSGVPGWILAMCANLMDLQWFLMVNASMGNSYVNRTSPPINLHQG